MSSTDSPLRVAYLVKRYPRYSETFIVNEIIEHETAGVDIEIFSLKFPEDRHFQDIISFVKAPVYYLPDRNVKVMDFWSALNEAGDILPDIWNRLKLAQGEDPRDVYQALRLSILLCKKGINHIHAHFATKPAIVARLASLFTGIPFTFTAHAKDIYHNDADDEAFRHKLRDAFCVITVSDFNLNYLRSRYGPEAARVKRIYNGVDLTRFHYKRPEPARFDIIAVGRLVEKKGFSLLVEACSILKENGSNFHCRIIGTGPLEHPLRSRIEELGLEGEVEVIGSRPQREVIEDVQSASVFVAPCIVGDDGNRDGLPTVLLEAMALGTPCISTDVTGIPEIVKNEVTGMLVPQKNARAIADGIERLLTDFSLACSISDQARQLIESEFDIRHTTVKMREIFSHAVEDGQSVKRGIA